MSSIGSAHMHHSTSYPCFSLQWSSLLNNGTFFPLFVVICLFWFYLLRSIWLVSNSAAVAFFLSDPGHKICLTVLMPMQAYIEKEDSKKLKQKQRERMQPKMGKMDIDYQVSSSYQLTNRTFPFVFHIILSSPFHML